MVTEQQWFFRVMLFVSHLVYVYTIPVNEESISRTLFNRLNDVEKTNFSDSAEGNDKNYINV